ncbi:MAG: hypothetical protein Q7J86_08760 [Bacteroidota bacterium]|nr:hypothetical protein [Bacteroidota bacterium]
MGNFKIEMFRTPACQGLSGREGTQDFVVEIPVRHMNVTACPDFYQRFFSGYSF